MVQFEIVYFGKSSFIPRALDALEGHTADEPLQPLQRHAYAYGKQVWLRERSGYCAPWPPHYHRCITDFAARKKRSAAADNARKRYAEAQAIAKKKCADWQPSSCLVADTDGTWRALGQLPLSWKHSRGIGSIGRTHS